MFEDIIVPLWPRIPGPILPGNPAVSRPSYPTPADIIAKVKVRLTQDLVLTRSAFKATLELENQSSTSVLSNILVSVHITDTNGLSADELFGVSSPMVLGMTAVDGSGILDLNETGLATWTIVPGKTAAPETATVYGVGGTLQYTFNGQVVTIPLYAAPITVYPDPALYVKYFHQRDVFSDDPFTPTVEPSVTYLLGVLVENRGKGTAKDVSIISGQPEIVENELGLLVDFKIIGVKVAGQDQVPSLTAKFGDIGPDQRGVGLWFLTSTLQGFFDDYTATFQHLDNFGKTNLSILDEVTIHELTHLVQASAPTDDGIEDFLVNDVADPDNLPDRIYFSDGGSNLVTSITQASTDGPVSPGDLVVQLTATMPSGFVYLRVPEPGNAQYKLKSIVRSDSMPIVIGRNAWTTDRTFIAGFRPRYENKLHIFDHDSTGVYTLTYEVLPPPDTNSPVSQITALAASSYESINLTWTGSDTGGSGLAYYDVFASVDGGPYQIWLQGTTLTGTIFPGQFGSSYSFYSVATDYAGNQEAPPGSPDAQTFVSLTNNAPVMIGVTNITISEGQTLVVTLAATDPDPEQDVTYSLSGAPALAVISPSGTVIWPTSETTGPATNSFLVIARDNGLPSLSATSVVTVVVSEINVAPVLAAINSYNISEGYLLRITNLTTDLDIPANTLTYSFSGPVPAGATLNSTNGLFAWQPGATQGPSTNSFTIVVTDNGIPSLSDSRSFTVVVRDELSDFTMVLGWTNLLGGENGFVPLTLNASLPLTNINFELSIAAEALTNLSLTPVSSEVVSATVTSLGQGGHAVNIVLNPALQTATTRTLLDVDFTAAPSAHSAVVWLAPEQILAGQSGGSVITNGAAIRGRIIVVNSEPVLDISPGVPPSLTLYGLPDVAYSIMASTNLALVDWNAVTNLVLTNRLIVLPLFDATTPERYYRAVEQ